MASTDALPIPRKNVAYRAVFPLLDADGDLVTGAAGLDSEVSKDQGTFADCTNEATEIATSSGMYYLDLTSTEMNADCVAVIVKTSTSGAKTTCLVFYPQESGDIKVDVQSLLGTAWLTPGTAGTPDVNVKLWNALATVELPLVPTTAGRKLDVSAGGEAGLDWANVGSPTTTVDLSGTTIKTTQKVDVDTIKTNPVVNGGTITFPTTATLASTTNITAGTITTVTNLTNAPTAGDLTAAMKASVNAEADTALSDVGVTSTVTGRIDAAISTRATQTSVDTVDDFVDTEVAAILAAVDTEVAAIKAKTDSLTFTVASVVDANVSNVNGSTTGVDKLAAHLPSVLKLVVGTGSTTTAIVFSTVNGSAGSSVDDFYNGRVIVFTSGALAGQATSISDYTGSTTTATVPAVTGAPVNGVTAVIV